MIKLDAEIARLVQQQKEPLRVAGPDQRDYAVLTWEAFEALAKRLRVEEMDDFFFECESDQPRP